MYIYYILNDELVKENVIENIELSQTDTTLALL